MNNPERIMIWGAYVEVGQKNPVHAHEMHELVVCLSSCGEHWIEGDCYPFIYGQTLLIRNGIPHYVLGNPREVAKLLFICFDTYPFAATDSPSLHYFLKECSVNKQHTTRKVHPVFRDNVEIATKVQTELTKIRPFNNALMISLLQQLIINHCRSLYQSDLYKNDRNTRAITEVCAWITNNYGTPFTLKDMAIKAGMSRTLFTRMFRLFTGLTLTEFSTRIRIDAVMKLLAETDDSVASIAFQCGFNNMGYFYQTFKRFCNMLPGEYRKSIKSHGPFIRRLRLMDVET